MSISKVQKIEEDLETIRLFKKMAISPGTGWCELIKLAIKTSIFIYASIQESVLENTLDKIKKLIYDTERKQNNQTEVNTNEGIG